MLRTANHLMGYSIAGSDGEVGHCSDFLFHDNDWRISYLVIDTGAWLPGRKVVVPPSVISRPDWESKTIPVALSVEQIKKGPTLESKDIVSSDYERQCLAYYNWPTIVAATTGIGGTIAPPTIDDSVAQSIEDQGDNHLRSMKTVETYEVSARDGEIGRIADFVFDDEAWQIRYLTAETGTWLSGRQVLISLQWVNAISWAKSMVDVDLSIEAIKASPAFDPTAAINREYEARLYDYYGKPVDW